MSNFGSHLHQDANLSDANPRLIQFWLWKTSQLDTCIIQNVKNSGSKITKEDI